jgi:hypothetical protein
MHKIIILLSTVASSRLTPLSEDGHLVFLYFTPDNTHIYAHMNIHNFRHVFHSASIVVVEYFHLSNYTSN